MNDEELQKIAQQLADYYFEHPKTQAILAQYLSNVLVFGHNDLDVNKITADIIEQVQKYDKENNKSSSD